MTPDHPVGQPVYVWQFDQDLTRAIAVAARDRLAAEIGLRDHQSRMPIQEIPGGLDSWRAEGARLLQSVRDAEEAFYTLLYGPDSAVKP